MRAFLSNILGGVVMLAGVPAWAQVQPHAQVHMGAVDISATSLVDGSAVPLTFGVPRLSLETFLVRGDVTQSQVANSDGVPISVGFTEPNGATSGSVGSLAGPLMLDASLSDPSGYWQKTVTTGGARTSLQLPGQTTLTVSGHILASYDAPKGSDGWIVFQAVVDGIGNRQEFIINDVGFGNVLHDEDFHLVLTNTSTTAYPVDLTFGGATYATYEGFAVPEPHGWMLLAAGLPLVAVRRRRRCAAT